MVAITLVPNQDGKKQTEPYRYTINSNRLHGETEDGKEISLKKYRGEYKL